MSFKSDVGRMGVDCTSKQAARCSGTYTVRREAVESFDRDDAVNGRRFVPALVMRWN